ncbi:hypothetical protein [Sedimentibacter sp.]|uniref:hypothetical protein n=1 Tax=Sedimentibacter sp. TaxID=1960295 RepID=UPI00289B30C1|nr:hypothetical protein [Sedimentibacter sp.]
MSWSLEISLLFFLIIVFLSQLIATKLSSYIPMPLVLGIISIIGFATGLVPKDVIEKSNMIAVGTIAYNMFVVNSGSMIDLKFIRRFKIESIICLVSSLAIFLIVGIGMRGAIGKELALLSSGAVIGGGATCAIASYVVMGIKPELAVYPWMIFMFQGLFAVPAISWALKKEAAVCVNDFRSRNTGVAAFAAPTIGFGTDQTKLYNKVNNRYKTTAYYLAIVMAINVLNKYVHSKLNIGINQNATALLAGFLFSQTGLIEAGPLHKSDSFGLLLLGLMGLMVNTLSKNPLGNILRLIPPMIVMFLVSMAVLTITAIVFSKIYKVSPYGRIAMNLNCIMGFPVNKLLVERAARIGETNEEKEYISMKLSPLINIGTMLVVNTISIIITAFAVKLIM